MNSLERGKQLNRLVEAGGSITQIRSLIKQGADLEWATTRGDRALHHASRAQNLAVMQLLLESGAQVSSQTQYGNTPLKLCLQNKTTREHQIAMIRLFRSFGDTSNLPAKFADLEFLSSNDNILEPEVSQSLNTLNKSRDIRSSHETVAFKSSRPVSEQRQNKGLSKVPTPQAELVSIVQKYIDTLTKGSEEKRLLLRRQADLERQLNDGIHVADLPRTFIDRLRDGQYNVMTDTEYLRQQAEVVPEYLLYTALGLSVHPLFVQDAKEALKLFQAVVEENAQADFSALWLLAHARILKSQGASGAAYNTFVLFQKYTESSNWILDTDVFVRPKNSTATNRSSSKLSPIETKWEDIKEELRQTCNGKQFKEKVEPMEELFEMAGLDSVKEIAISTYAKVLSDQRLSESARVPSPLNFSFMGNPGTGKTTVARIFGKLLHTAGVREKDECVETSAQSLISKGPAEFEKMVEQARGGVLFIDEAYALDPLNDKMGKSIVDIILTAAENYRDELTIILAGYKEDMESKIYRYNIGLKSRFTDVLFEDFNVEQLRQIWNGFLKKYNRDDTGWRVESDRVSEVATNRLARRIGTKGFGNARDVRVLFQRAVNSSQVRSNELPPTLKMEDIIGREPNRKNIPELDVALKELESQTGLEKVKKQVEQLLALAQENYAAELKGEKPKEVTLNRLFVGNPGTGKTTIAKIYGRILKALGLLSDGSVEFKSASDLMGQYVGESQQKTLFLIELCQGKVLVIDEAYNLDDQMYGKQALDTIVEKVMGKPGEDIAVIMCGYEREMHQMLRNQNPGLKRRFNPDNQFEFEDFTDEQLLYIMKSGIQREGLQVELDTLFSAVKELSKKRAMANFGNAGAVFSMISDAKIRLSERVFLAKQAGQPLAHPNRLLLEDLIGEDNVNLKDPFEVLQELQNTESIIEQLERFSAGLQVWKRDGGRKPPVGNFLFLGNPGTGKTTIAREMGRIFRNMGVLASGHVEETTAKKLTGQYVGQTKEKVEAAMEAAAGGILFIDEAYTLNPNGEFDREVVTTLLQLLTDPRYSNDKTIVVMAGYEDKMDQMLSMNEGLTSRFPNRLHFHDWSSSACLELVQKEFGDDFELSDSTLTAFASGFERLRNLKGWSNARDVITIVNEVTRERSIRVLHNREPVPSIVAEDVNAVFDLQEAQRRRLSEIVKSERPMVSNARTQTQAPPLMQPVKVNEVEVIEQVDEDLQDEAVVDASVNLESLLDDVTKRSQALFQDLDKDILALQGELKEKSLEGILNDMGYAGEDADWSGILGDGLNHPDIQSARNQIINTLVQQGGNYEDVKERVDKAIADFLEQKREAERLRVEAERIARLLSRIPRYVCEYCKRPWGVCTYLGPYLVGYDYPDGSFERA